MTDYDKDLGYFSNEPLVIEDGKIHEDDIVSVTLGPDNWVLPDTITISDNDYNLSFDDLAITFDDSIVTTGTTTYNHDWGVHVFKDYIPTVREIERMCDEYPALEKAYENFKTVYKMVEQDYKGKQNDS